MSEQTAISGKCLCGSVTLTCPTPPKEMTACHCTTCRTWSGGPFLGFAASKDLVISGEESISVFNSSAWAERGFCKSCGNHLFYRMKTSGDYYLPAGMFTLPADTPFAMEVFIDEKPENYSFEGTRKCMTGPELFAAFSGNQ